MPESLVEFHRVCSLTGECCGEPLNVRLQVLRVRLLGAGGCRQRSRAASLHALGALTALVVHYDGQVFKEQLLTGLDEYGFSLLVQMAGMAARLLKRLAATTGLSPAAVIGELARERIEWPGPGPWMAQLRAYALDATRNPSRPTSSVVASPMLVAGVDPLRWTP